MQAAKAEIQPTLEQVHKHNLQYSNMRSPSPEFKPQDNTCSPEAKNHAQDSPELDSAAFKGFVEEVAARIIQTYWRKLQASRTAFPSGLLNPPSLAPTPRNSSAKKAPFDCGVYSKAVGDRARVNCQQSPSPCSWIRSRTYIGPTCILEFDLMRDSPVL